MPSGYDIPGYEKFIDSTKLNRLMLLQSDFPLIHFTRLKVTSVSQWYSGTHCFFTWTKVTSIFYVSKQWHSYSHKSMPPGTYHGYLLEFSSLFKMMNHLKIELCDDPTKIFFSECGENIHKFQRALQENYGWCVEKPRKDTLWPS